MEWIWAIFLLILLFGGGGLTFVRQALESRQRHQLEMKKIELKIADARAREAEAITKRDALGVRAAELEIERFDRRMTTTGLPPVPRLTSGVDPDILREIAASTSVDDAATQEITAVDQPRLKKHKEKE